MYQVRLVARGFKEIEKAKIRKDSPTVVRKKGKFPISFIN